MSTRNVYSPHGVRSTATASTGVVGFNGEFFHAALGCYALGNGHRVYNPRLMRFISPDALSPFLKGGINAYAYCLNDPVNGRDPSGKVPFLKSAVQVFGRFATQAASRFKSLTQDGGPTNNQYWNMREEMSYARQHVKKSKTLYRVISSRNGFEQLEPGLNHKFVFTNEKRLVVFSSKDDATMPSHGSLAEYSGQGFGTKGLGEKAISAGYIVIGDNGQISLNHYSGHFQPRFEDLYPVEEYAKGLGVEVALIRIGFYDSP